MRAALPVFRSPIPLFACLALFGVVCLYRLDVYPLLYFDETAYLRAASMQAGLLEPGPIVKRFGGGLYVLEQFQSQLLPFAVHTGVVALRGFPFSLGQVEGHAWIP